MTFSGLLDRLLELALERPLFIGACAADGIASVAGTAGMHREASAGN
jgi:hypothetical protein